MNTRERLETMKQTEERNREHAEEYAKAILSRWSKEGIKTVEQARADSNRDKFERSKPDYSFDEENPYGVEHHTH